MIHLSLGPVRSNTMPALWMIAVTQGALEKLTGSGLSANALPPTAGSATQIAGILETFMIKEIADHRTAQPMAKKQKFPHLVGSKWTAQEKTFGWRHFQVVNRKNEHGIVFAEMVAACDPEVRFWINAKGLKNCYAWQAGWKSRQEQQSS